MVKKAVNLIFPKKLVKEPVIYNIGQKFKVVTNIRKADVNADFGFVLLELDGNLDEINKAVDYAKKAGVNVEFVEVEEN